MLLRTATYVSLRGVGRVKGVSSSSPSASCKSSRPEESSGGVGRPSLELHRCTVNEAHFCILRRSVRMRTRTASAYGGVGSSVGEESSRRRRNALQFAISTDVHRRARARAMTRGPSLPPLRTPCIANWLSPTTRRRLAIGLVAQRARRARRADILRFNVGKGAPLVSSWRRVRAHRIPLHRAEIDRSPRASRRRAPARLSAPKP